MRRLQLYIAGEPHSLRADLGFVVPGDPHSLELHAGSCAGRHELILFAGGRPGRGGVEIELNEVEPGWYQPTRKWHDLLETRPIFGLIEFFVVAHDRICAVSELEIPLAEENQKLFVQLREDLDGVPKEAHILEGLQSFARSRLFGSDEFAMSDWIRRIVDRANEAVGRVEKTARLMSRDAVEFSSYAPPKSIALTHLPFGVARGFVGQDGSGRGVPTQFARVRPKPDYDTPLNRTARAFVKEIVDEGEGQVKQLFSDARRGRGDARMRLFGDPLARRRVERLEMTARSLSRALNGLKRSLAKGRPLGDAQDQVRARFPVPLPPHLGFRTLRVLQSELSAYKRGELDQAALAGMLRRQAFDVPSLEGLYERWVGLKIIDAIKSLGLDCLEDVPAESKLRPGQRIRFGVRGGAHHLIMFIEPTFTPGTSPIRGVALAQPRGSGDERQRLTPDYAIVRTHPYRSRPLLILDATLSKRPEVLEWKGRYTERLVLTRRKNVLGAMRLRGAVLSSLAVYPGKAKELESDDFMLRRGTLPLRPGRPDQYELLVELLRLLLDEDGPLLS